MKREIYLVWQTDEWLSHNSKVLAYIGESYEDCQIEIDDFVVPAEVVDANEDNQVIIDYVAGVEYEITPNNQR